MTKFDEFESAFRSASKARFHLSDVRVRKVMVVTDLQSAAAAAFCERVQTFLGHLGDAVAWEVTPPDALETVQGLLERVEAAAPDLIVTYRNLGTEAWRYPWSLGVHLDVLTQATTTPVLVVPHPKDEPAQTLTPINEVMVVTDHLTGDDRLVNHALRYLGADGTLVLTHVEDQHAFDHLLDVISKVPEIDSELAKARIGAQLLKEPRDYIDSVQDSLRAGRPGLNVASEVRIEHELPAYRRLVEQHGVDLLVTNTKDAEQLAMDGLAHALAIELRAVPMLLL